MSHFLRLEDDTFVCDYPAGEDLLELGFVTVDSTDSFPCVACSIVLAAAGNALDDAWKNRGGKR